MERSERNPHYLHRSCYVNFGEHLQNTWNPNMFYSGAPNRWSFEDWRRFLEMIKAFGYNCFEYWLTPTLYDKPALGGAGIYSEFAATMRAINDIAHSIGIKTKLLCVPSLYRPELALCLSQ